MGATTWTDERIDELTRLVADGNSAGQIGVIMHVTRNSIIGKASRLGLQLHGCSKSIWQSDQNAMDVSTHGLTRRKIPRPPKPTVAPTATATAAPAEPTVLDWSAPMPPEPISRALTLVELDAGCHWIDGDGFLYCGHKRYGNRAFCEHHSRRAYQPPSRRRDVFVRWGT